MALMRLSLALRNQLADRFTTLIDGGDASGMVKFYTGAMPFNVDSPVVVQTLLATLTFSKPSALAAIGGVLTFDVIYEDNAAAASGVATWARITDGAGNGVIDVNVSGVGGGGIIELNTTAIAKGGPVRITQFTLMMPAG